MCWEIAVFSSVFCMEQERAVLRWFRLWLRSVSMKGKAWSSRFAERALMFTYEATRSSYSINRYRLLLNVMEWWIELVWTVLRFQLTLRKPFADALVLHARFSYCSTILRIVRRFTSPISCVSVVRLGPNCIHCFVSQKPTILVRGDGTLDLRSDNCESFKSSSPLPSPPLPLLPPPPPPSLPPSLP